MSREKVQNLEFADSNLGPWSFDDKREFAMFKVWKLNQKRNGETDWMLFLKLMKMKKKEREIEFVKEKYAVLIVCGI